MTQNSDKCKQLHNFQLATFPSYGWQTPDEIFFFFGGGDGVGGSQRELEN